MLKRLSLRHRFSQDLIAREGYPCTAGWTIVLFGTMNRGSLFNKFETFKWVWSYQS